MNHIAMLAVIVVGDVAIGLVAYSRLRAVKSKVAATLIGGWLFNALCWVAFYG